MLGYNGMHEIKLEAEKKAAAGSPSGDAGDCPINTPPPPIFAPLHPPPQSAPIPALGEGTSGPTPPPPQRPGPEPSARGRGRRDAHLPDFGLRPGARNTSPFAGSCIVTQPPPPPRVPSISLCQPNVSAGALGSGPLGLVRVFKGCCCLWTAEHTCSERSPIPRHVPLKPRASDGLRRRAALVGTHCH